MEPENRETYNLRFARAASHLLVGPSASGKTWRVADILRLKNDIIEGGSEVTNIVFFYEVWQPIYQRLMNEGIVTKWIKGAPSNESFIDAVQPYANIGGSIVVIDDFEQNSAASDFSQIVRVTSRHMNASTFLLFQSLFPSQRFARAISLNVKYLHIHKNPRENAQIQYLARQLSPHSYKWIVEAYHEITRKPFSCMLIDLTQNRQNFLRYRSNYLPAEKPMKVWFEKGSLPPLFK